MKNMKKRKGFTLTELAIVIAVIAILIAVLVPTFTSLINKAHESTDSQLAKNMNTLLANEEAYGNTPARMEDVNYILEEGGYKLENLNPTAEGNIFVWNSTTNRISYIDEDGTVLYAGDSTLTADSTFAGGNNYWVTAKTSTEITTWQDYQISYYIASSSFESSTITFKYAVGVDTGTYTVGEIVYDSLSSKNITVANTKVGGNNAKVATDGTTSSSAAELRGTIKTLTVNASIEVVNYASITSETKIKSATSYTERGYSKSLVVETTSSNVVKVASDGYVDSLTGSGKDNVTSEGYVGNASSLSNITNSNTYSVSSYSELASFRDKVNGGATFEDITVTLTANIDISGRVWTPIGYTSRDNTYTKNNCITYTQEAPYGDTRSVKSDSYICFKGIFNGNGKTISGLTNSGFMPTDNRSDTYGGSSVSNCVYGLFGIIDGATIKNLTLTNVNIVYDSETTAGDSTGAIAGYAIGSVTISDCTVSGSVVGIDAVGGIVGRILSLSNGTDTTTYTVAITNCVNNASVTSTEGKAGGIVGYYQSFESGDTVNITGCTNNGTVTSQTTDDGAAYAAGIIVVSGSTDNNTTKNKYYIQYATFATITLDDCHNTGAIKMTNAATLTKNEDGTTSIGGKIGTMITTWNWKDSYMKVNSTCDSSVTLSASDAKMVFDFDSSSNSGSYGVLSST